MGKQIVCGLNFNRLLTGIWTGIRRNMIEGIPSVDNQISIRSFKSSVPFFVLLCLILILKVVMNIVRITMKPIYITVRENLTRTLVDIKNYLSLTLCTPVECDSTSVFISGAPLSSPTRHSFMSTFFCERKPGLHPGNCFKIYHTFKNHRIQQ